MAEPDKETLEKHTKALNRVAAVFENFIKGLPGLVNQLEKNEAIMMLQHDRAKTRDQISQDIDEYERKKKEEQNAKRKTTGTK